MGDTAPFKTIGARYPAELVDELNADATRLGLTQSEWMRMAVNRTLAEKMTVPSAAAFRRGPTQEEERARRRRIRQEAREQREAAAEAARAERERQRQERAAGREREGAGRARDAEPPPPAPNGNGKPLERASVTPRPKVAAKR